MTDKKVVALQEFLLAKEAIMQGIKVCIKEYLNAYKLASELTPMNFKEKEKQFNSIIEEMPKTLRKIIIEK